MNSRKTRPYNVTDVNSGNSVITYTLRYVINACDRLRSYRLQVEDPDVLSENSLLESVINATSSRIVGGPQYRTRQLASIPNKQVTWQ